MRFDDTVTDEKKVDDPKNPPKLEAVKPKVKSTERRKLESNDLDLGPKVSEKGETPSLKRLQTCTVSGMSWNFVWAF